MQFLLLVSFQKIKRTGAYRGLNLELKERWTTWRLHGGLLQNILLREEESVPFPASVPLFLCVGFPNCSVRTASEYSQCPLTPRYLPLSVPIIPPISYLWPGPGCWITIPLPLPIPGPDTASQASNVHYTQYRGGTVQPGRPQTVKPSIKMAAVSDNKEVRYWDLGVNFSDNESLWIRKRTSIKWKICLVRSILKIKIFLILF